MQIYPSLSYFISLQADLRMFMNIRNFDRQCADLFRRQSLKNDFCLRTMRFHKKQVFLILLK